MVGGEPVFDTGFMLVRLTAASVVTAMLVMPATAGARRPRRTSAFVSYSPLAAFDMAADGHGPTEKGIHEVGLGCDLLWRLSPHFEAGIGLRFDTGLDTAESNGVFVAVPALARWIVGGAHDHLRVGAALGLGYANLSQIEAIGPTSEISLGYQHVFSTTSVFLDVGVRVEMLSSAASAHSPGGTLFNGQLPFLRVGVVWHRRGD